MLHNDRAALYNIIQELGSENGIRRIRLFNKEGRITFPPKPRKSTRWSIRTRKPATDAISSRRRLTKLNRKDRARRFSDRQGRSVLAVIQPVDNAPECSNAACHVHPAGAAGARRDRRQSSLATVDDQMALHQANLAYFLVGAILLGSALAVAFIWVVVYRPVKKLIAGTHRVADGDLAYRLPVGSDDELGDLARSFNKMTAEVEGVQAEIEERVRRKTAELEKIHKTLLQLGEDGLDRQAGGHRGARDQQSAFRHPDLRAPDAARHPEAGFRRRATKWRNSCRPSSARASAAATW